MIIQLILLLGLLIPLVLFLITQQNTLKAVDPIYREMKPGLVWLQLIPIFNYYWVFVVVTRIADSISKQMVAMQDDSILGVANFDAVENIGKRPTYKIGMAWCCLYVVFLGIAFFNAFSTYSENTTATGALLILGMALAIMTCWIIYWVQLAKNKRMLELGRNARV